MTFKNVESAQQAVKAGYVRSQSGQKLMLQAALTEDAIAPKDGIAYQISAPDKYTQAFKLLIDASERCATVFVLATSHTFPAAQVFTITCAHLSENSLGANCT